MSESDVLSYAYKLNKSYFTQMLDPFSIQNNYPPSFESFLLRNAPIEDNTFLQAASMTG